MLKRSKRDDKQNTIPSPWSLRVRGFKAKRDSESKWLINSDYFIVTDLLKVLLVAREVPNCQCRSKLLMWRYWTVLDCSWAVQCPGKILQ